jgi:hypothetical protein
MTTALTRRLTSFFLVLRRHRRSALPRLESLNLSDRALDDLNLPPDVRARFRDRRPASFGDLV